MIKVKLAENLKKCQTNLSILKRCTPQEFINGNYKEMLKGIAIIFITSYLFYENLWMTLLMWPYLFFYMKDYSKRQHKKENLKQMEEFKDGLLAVSFSLNVGYSVENAFREALQELKKLYGDEAQIVKSFTEIVHRVNRNENLEDVLDDYAAKSKIEDVLYFAEVFKFAKRSGGNLIRVIHDTADTIRQKVEIGKQIETIISGKQLEQKIMSCVPYGMILYLKLTAPDLISGLYGNTAGNVIMTICLIILVCSDYWAKRIVDIEV